MPRQPARVAVFGALLLAGAAAVADITVKGTVYYWNGHERDDKAGTIGAWKPAANTQVQVENDCLAVGDITTYTDWTGQYNATFHQRFFRPDFNHLRANVEVRAQVRLEQGGVGGTAGANDITVACYKTNYILGLDVGGPARLFPYNGQTGDVYIKDKETRTLNVYVGPKECPDPPAPTVPDTQNLRVTSWDYDDDGRRTTAAIFMTQCCYEEYRFLVDNCADKKNLRRSTSIFYPANKSAYVFKPQKGAWIDMRKEDLLKDEEARDEERWANWQDLRCTVLHEHAHKLMHDVYWTLPKPYPWGHGGNPFSDEGNDHDPLSCKTAEMGLCEGWADFLPAALQRSPTLKGLRVFRTAAGHIHAAYNIEHAWYPGLPKNVSDGGYAEAGGNVAWRTDVTGRRDWNETEVAAVLWDVHDGTGWEDMPRSQQDAKPAAWPAHLQWFERLWDPKLERIWAIIREEPECLNDEGEMAINRDSFWTFWLAKHGGDKGLVHGLKAILHNREMAHELKPQHAPEIAKVRVLPGCSTVLFADLAVKEADEEDRPFLYYNVAYGKSKGAEPLKLLHTSDQPLEGEWAGDQLAARIRLPARDQWDRLIVKVHDSMTCAFAQAGDATWRDDSAGGGPRLRLIAASGGQPALPSTAAVGAGGSVWLWGASQTFLPGILAKPPGRRPGWLRYANQVQGISGVVAVASSPTGHYVALKSDGTVWTFSSPGLKTPALGLGDLKPSGHPYPPKQVPGLTDVVSVDAHTNIAVALKADGTVWAWGHNDGYNLGDGTTTTRHSPVQVQGLTTKIKALSTLLTFTLAVDTGGEVWVWGGWWHKKPDKLPDLRNIVDVVAGRPSLALDKDGVVWEAPDRDEFRVYLGARRVPGLPRIVAIAGKHDLHAALDEHGRIWTWAATNAHGQLGDPKRQKPDDCSRPALVASIGGWVAVAAGQAFGAAVHQDGYAAVWGLGNARGDGEHADAALPCTVLTLHHRTTTLAGEGPEARPMPLWLFH